VASLPLLPPHHQQIVELLCVPTPDVLTRGVPLPVVGQELPPGAQVGKQLLQLLGVPGLGPVGLQIGTGGILCWPLGSTGPPPRWMMCVW